MAEDKNYSPLHVRLAQLPADFAGLADLYESNLRPLLEEKERQRKTEAGKAKQFGMVGGAVGLVAVLIAFFTKLPFLAILGLVGGGGTWFFGSSGLRRMSGEAKELMVVPIANQFGILYNSIPGVTTETNLPLLRGLSVIPSWDRRSLQDEMIGERNGVRFEFFEAHLEQKSTTTDSKGRTRTTWSTVFRGQCWVFDAPKNFHGTTRLTRDSGIFNALGGLGSKQDRVRLEDPDFEKIFEVYGTDQVEARFLLTPDVMQAFVDLERVFKGQRLRVAFHDKKIFAAAEGGNLFEQDAMFIPLDNPDRVGDLLEDFAAMFHLIDVLGRK